MDDLDELARAAGHRQKPPGAVEQIGYAAPRPRWFPVAQQSHFGTGFLFGLGFWLAGVVVWIGGAVLFTMVLALGCHSAARAPTPPPPNFAPWLGR